MNKNYSITGIINKINGGKEKRIACIKYGPTEVFCAKDIKKL